MSDLFQLLVLAGIVVVMILTRSRAASLGGFTVLALSAMFLVAAIVDPANKFEYAVSFLIGVMFALMKFGFPGTIPSSHLAFRIDGVIEVAIAAGCLALSIVLPAGRVCFLLLFLLIGRLGLGRLGFHARTNSR
jgi:hypothetical protein